MSPKKIVFISIVTFLIGLASGFLVAKYVLPKLGLLENTLQDESIYQVEHNVCPEPEIPVECSIFVDISGALNNPGVYCFNPGDRVIDAVKKAGGFNSTALLEYIARSINLSKPLVSNQKLYIPSTNELLCELKPFTLKPEDVVLTNTVQGTTGETTDPQDGTTDAVQSECISINTGSITELDSLEGIGPSTAQKIIDNRPYNSLTDLLKVSGIGQATYDKFKNNICL